MPQVCRHTPACREVQGGRAGVPGFEPSLPHFIGGISLGGCIAFNAALADSDAGSQLFKCAGAGVGRPVGARMLCRPVMHLPTGRRRPACSAASPRCRGAVLLAPMLSLEKVSRKGLNPYIRPLASPLSWLAPTAAIVATEKNTLYPHIQVGRGGGGGGGGGGSGAGGCGA